MRSRAKVALISTVGGSTIIPNSGGTVDVLTLDEWQRVRLPTFVLGERSAKTPRTAFTPAQGTLAPSGSSAPGHRDSPR